MLRARNAKLSTFSGLRQALLSVTMLPSQLKTRSAATLVAHTHKYFYASFATVEYLTASTFYQSCADSSSSCFTRW